MEFVRPLEPILIIDDEKETRDYLNKILTALGFEDILDSTDFASAILLVEKKPPNVIFFNIDLPDSDGKIILDKINQLYPNAMVIMCSGHNSFENVQNTCELGTKSVIAKPFNAKKVESVMKRLELELIE